MPGSARSDMGPSFSTRATTAVVELAQQATSRTRLTMDPVCECASRAMPRSRREPSHGQLQLQDVSEERVDRGLFQSFETDELV